MVIWTVYGYGYEGRFGLHGRPFARVKRIEGGGWELKWLYGPRRWRPMYARLARTLTDMADKYAMRHRAHIEAQMPTDPLMVVFSDTELADAFWPGYRQQDVPRGRHV
jgi:hypothetical protein